MEFRQLLPTPASLTADALLSSLEPVRTPPGRPYVMVNFIASLDGRATFQGRSGQLGDEGDRAMFHGLREQVDAVMAGTGTLRVERYGRILGQAQRRQRRAEQGLRPEPVACIVTWTGALPLDIPLFSEPEARVIVFSAADIDLAGVAADTEVVRVGLEELTLTAVLGRLHAEFEVRTLLCEGGPTLFGSLLHERLVDELFLTLAPRLAGGGPAPAITTGAELATMAELTPLWLLERAGYLYLRYALR